MNINLNTFNGNKFDYDTYLNKRSTILNKMNNIENVAKRINLNVQDNGKIQVIKNLEQTLFERHIKVQEELSTLNLKLVIADYIFVEKVKIPRTFNLCVFLGEYLNIEEIFQEEIEIFERLYQETKHDIDGKNKNMLWHINNYYSDIIRTKSIVKRCKKCGKDNSKLCQGCSKVSYCGVECQKLNWNNHKKSCKRISVRSKMYYLYELMLYVEKL